MTVTIELAADLESQLCAKAEREGKTVEVVLQEVVASALEWEARDREEAIAGIRRGLEASNAGRVKPVAQVIAEARAKHGFPDPWPMDPGVK